MKNGWRIIITMLFLAYLWTAAMVVYSPKSNVGTKIAFCISSVPILGAFGMLVKLSK